MSSAIDIPELAALETRNSFVRIAGEQDVPVTPRIRKLIDTAPFQKLRNISQLGLVSLVYPGATHSRFEHSLGVYRNALLFLNRLNRNRRFTNSVTEKEAALFLVAALLHDAGHWPYCHPIEDMQLDGIPHHEALARTQLADPQLEAILDSEFGVCGQDVADLLEGKDSRPSLQLLHSMLSGPVDVDKMDYLYRDSLHAGVPYGMQYDRSRLIGALCLNELGNGLAITEKGGTAAELMVFARYVMFREVYWHHAVRSATAMLQRAFFELAPGLEIPTVFEMTDAIFQQSLLQQASSKPAEPLVTGLFGPQRSIYKRLAQFDVHDHPELFQRYSRQPYDRLVRSATTLADVINARFGLDLSPCDILVDAPPQGLEVQFRIDIRTASGQYRPMQNISPVVHALAAEQFDNVVKRVRVFVHPDQAAALSGKPDLLELLLAAADQADL